MVETLMIFLTYDFLKNLNIHDIDDIYIVFYTNPHLNVFTIKSIIIFFGYVSKLKRLRLLVWYSGICYYHAKMSFNDNLYSCTQDLPFVSLFIQVSWMIAVTWWFHVILWPACLERLVGDLESYGHFLLLAAVAEYWLNSWRF